MRSRSSEQSSPGRSSPGRSSPAGRRAAVAGRRAAVAGLTIVGSVLGGGGVAVLGVVVHQLTTSGRWPVGVLLAWALTASSAVFLRACRATGWARAGALGAWFVVVWLAASPGSDHELLVPGNGRGMAFLLGGAAVLAALVVLPAGAVRPGRG